MTITAVVDRIENDTAVLLSNEISVEICVPLSFIEGVYVKGEILTLTLDREGNIKF